MGLIQRARSVDAEPCRPDIMPQLQLKDILDALGCEHKVVGEREHVVERALPIDVADENTITFCNKRGDSGRSLLCRTRAGVIITLRDHEETCRNRDDRIFILVDDPRLAFSRVLRRYFAKARSPGVHGTAVIGQNVSISPDAFVGPFCNIGDDVTIGEGSRLLGSVTVYDKVRIGRRVTVHAGAVIGTDGFGYSRDPEGRVEKFPQIGGVVIEDDVEIGSNACIARGALVDTTIGRGTKIDNLVHIAHNVQVGKDCLIIAHAQIAGSVRIGDRCWLAPSCTINTGVSIGDDAMVALGSVVVRDVEPGTFVAGNPARPTIRKL